MQTNTIRTSARIELLDITDAVRKAISSSKISTGICTIFVPHTTAGVTINENADPSVKRDIIKETTQIVPANDCYEHTEGNSDAHIKSTFFGPSLTVIVENKKPVLGTWQGIFFCEFDGPRNRKYHIQVVGTKA